MIGCPSVLCLLTLQSQNFSGVPNVAFGHQRSHYINSQNPGFEYKFCLLNLRLSQASETRLSDIAVVAASIPKIHARRRKLAHFLRTRENSDDIQKFLHFLEQKYAEKEEEKRDAASAYAAATAAAEAAAASSKK